MIERFKRRKALCFLLFFSIAFAGIACCTYFLFLKNGKSFIWNYDGFKQHYAALVYLGRYYREICSGFLRGDFVIPMFEFSMGMGEDIITTMNFYGLGDPLTLFAALVPDAKMEYFYNFLVIFRLYLTGLAFSYFCREKGRSYGCTFIGALIYAFSGYALHVAVKHPFFVTPMIFLPLSVIGLERVLAKKRWTLLIGMVFLSALNGFYFFYMNTIFLVIYAVVWLCVHGRQQFIKKSLAAVERCAASYGIGLAMAAVIFVPVVAAYVTSTRSESSFSPGNLLFFDLDRYNAIFTRVIGPPRITWDYLGMVSLVFPALIILFMKKKDKILKVNIIIWTVLMLVPFGGYLLNGFSYVSGRFLYLVTFLYTVAVVYTLPELMRLGRKKLIVCMCGAAVYLAAVLFSSDVDKLYGWFGFIMLVITLATLYVGNRKKLAYSVFVPVLLVLTAVHIIGNGWLLFSGKGQGYVNAFIDSGKALAMLEADPEAEVPVCGEGEFYRSDASVKVSENAAVVNGNYGVSSYFSISNPNRISYLLQMDDGGVLDSMFKIEGMDDRTFLDALASVRYYVAESGKEERVPYGYRRIKDFVRGGKSYILYENDYVLPLGITFDSYVKQENAGNNQQTDKGQADGSLADGLRRQGAMLKTVVLEEDAEGVERLASLPEADVAELPFEVQESKNIEIREDGTVRVKRKGAVLRLSFQEEEEGELYVSLNGFRMTQKGRTSCEITTKSGKAKKSIQALSNRWNWYFGRNEYLFNLGLSNEKRNECAIKFQYAGVFDLSGLKLYTQRMTDYEQDIRERTEHTLENCKVQKNQIEGTVSLDRKKLLLLSIPYSEGWRARVDGSEVELLRADTAYMALTVDAGEHRIELYYRTPFIRLGGVLTLIGFAAFILYLAVEGKKSRGPGMDERESPEIDKRESTEIGKRESQEKEETDGV